MDKHQETFHNVIAMTEFKSEVGYSAISQVEAYWEALRGMRMMPKRSEIDPRGIETALEFTFVLERIAPGMARLRIAGSHLSDLMGMEVRGMPLTAFITPSGRRQMSDALEEVFQRPAICELRLSAETARDKPAMDARMILLPLKSDLGDVSRILGCFVARGEVGRSPRRFDVIGAKIRPITAPTDLPATDKEPDAPAKQPEVQGFAEPQVDYKARAHKHATDKRDVPYLRLIKNDD